MEELFNALVELFQSGKVSSKFENLKIEEDENGNVTVRCEAPKKSKVIEDIKAELDEMDDDVFTNAANKLRKGHPEVYKVLETLDDERPDVEAIKRAYPIFKQCVAEVVESKIRTLTDEVNRLFNKYLDKKVKA